MIYDLRELLNWGNFHFSFLLLLYSQFSSYSYAQSEYKQCRNLLLVEFSSLGARHLCMQWSEKINLILYSWIISIYLPWCLKSICNRFFFFCNKMRLSELISRLICNMQFWGTVESVGDEKVFFKIHQIFLIFSNHITHMSKFPIIIIIIIIIVNFKFHCKRHTKTAIVPFL